VELNARAVGLALSSETPVLIEIGTPIEVLAIYSSAGEKGSRWQIYDQSRP
jgi:hypothetical protein